MSKFSLEVAVNDSSPIQEFVVLSAGAYVFNRSIPDHNEVREIEPVTQAD